MTQSTEDQMLEALGVDLSPDPVRHYTPQEERLIAGFEDIQRFVEQHGHAPRHGENLDIFERLYAVRLDRLRNLPAARKLLEPMDGHGLLTPSATPQVADPADLDEDALLAALGAEGAQDDDITVLRHVRPHAERQAAEEVADRQPCKDFERFKPLFEQVQAELDGCIRKTLRFGRETSVEQGQFFVLAGQVAYIAEEGESFDSPQGKRDARLRVIFSNGTESNLLRLSLVRALYKDDTGRRITEPETAAGPLFADQMEEGDAESGTIYVLRSQSHEPFIAEHRELIHKIGVTGGRVENRIANASHDPTYLLADVDIVATYRLSGIHRVKLENLLHRFFAPARLELSIPDRFARKCNPREWFLVPLPVIDEAVNRIRDGSIADYVYDPADARMHRAPANG